MEDVTSGVALKGLMKTEVEERKAPKVSCTSFVLMKRSLRSSESVPVAVRTDKSLG